jgi:hypothetical protein
MNREELRKKKRGEDACVFDGANPAPPEICTPKERRALKRSDACDTPEVCVPDQFAPIPAPATLPASIVPIPDGLVVGNDELTKLCTDVLGLGPVGSSVTVAVNTFTRTFVWTEILDLKDSQQSFIDALQELDPSWGAVVLNGNISALTSLFKITTAQATTVRDTIDAFKSEVATEADSFALSQLDCYWVNTEQVAYCPANTVGSGEDIVASATVGAGTVTSYESQQDANEIAFSQATAELRCAVGNTALTRSCTDIGLEAVPNDLTPAYPGADLRIGSIDIATNTILVFVSNTANLLEVQAAKNNADAQAVELAESRLECFYFSPEVTKDCQNIDTDYAYVNAANPSTGTTGQTVLVPAGFFTSILGSTDALDQATLYADSLLNCFYVNDEVIETCGNYDPNNTTVELAGLIYAVINTTINGSPDSIYLPLNAAKSFSSANTTAGQFVSFSSKTDANAQATAFARAQLRCIYCNAEIAKKCVGTEDETKGIAAGSICSQFANEIYEIATAIADFRVASSIDSDDDCNFYSAVATAACPADPDLSPNSFPPVGSPIQLAKGAVTLTFAQTGAGNFTAAQAYVDALAQLQAESLLNCFYENDAVNIDCTSISKPMTGLHPDAVATSTASVDAGIFTSYSSKLEAQGQADSFAAAQLNCFYGSDAVNIDCTSISKPMTGLHPDANPTVPIAQYAFISYSNKTEANTLAYTFAAAQLNCFYGSAAVTAECPGDPAPANPVSGAVYRVAADGQKQPPAPNSFISYVDQPTATAMAQLFAESLLYCVYTNPNVTRTCDDKGLSGADAGSPVSKLVPEGTVFSAVSEGDAEQQAILISEASLVCLYSNTAATGSACPEGTEMVGEIGFVDAGTFISPVSQAATDEPAQALANALTVCVDGAALTFNNYNQDTAVDCGSSPFAISIDGTTITDVNGVVTQSSRFDIDVCGGKACYPSGDTNVNGANQSKSAPGTYRIYGRVNIAQTNNGPGDVSNGEVVIEETSVEATVGSNARYYVDGDNYVFLFLIGTVVAARRGGDTHITVTQTQVGDYSYYGSCNADGGDVDDDGANTHGGPREVIMCVNGEPYTTTIETTKLTKVTT